MPYRYLHAEQQKACPCKVIGQDGRRWCGNHAFYSCNMMWFQPLIWVPGRKKVVAESEPNTAGAAKASTD